MEDNRLERIINYYEELLYGALVDTYCDLLKVNLENWDCTSISIDNGKLSINSLDDKWDDVRRELFNRMIPEDRVQAFNKWDENICPTTKPGDKFSFSYRCPNKEKTSEYFWYTTNVKVFEENGQRVAMLFTIDNTEEVKERKFIKEKSERDELTYLYSRGKLNEMLLTEYQDMESCGLLFFDINNLKDVNDIYGHDAGDTVICHAAESLRSLQNRDVLAYRYGGDEFIVVAKNYSKEETEQLIGMWRERLAILTEDSLVPCSMSVGMAHSKAPVSIFNLIKEADDEMYHNKRGSKQGNSQLEQSLFVRHRMDQFFDVLKEHYVSVYEVNLEKDTFVTIYFNDKLTGRTIPQKGNYSEMNEKYLSWFVTEEFKSERIKIGEIASLRELLAESDRFEYDYRSTKLEELWMRVIFKVEERIDGVPTKVMMLHSIVDKGTNTVINVVANPSEPPQKQSIILDMGLKPAGVFFEMVDGRLADPKSIDYCMIAIDIEHFKMFNKWYGREVGDEYLKAIAMRIIDVTMQVDAVGGYLGGDNFAIFMPFDELMINKLQADIKSIAMTKSNTVGFLPAFGIYIISEKYVRAMNMYDNAMVALAHVIGNFDTRSCVYTTDMTEKMEEELTLISEIKDALEEHQFTFFAQPKCHMANGKVVGAEALVRWVHPTKGLIPPSVFIPVLENNGFIGDLDRYVWEDVCRWLHSWIEKGHTPVPISINVSRIDILSMDVASYLIELTQKYNVDHKYLKVEITESAYAENTDKIKETVRRLREVGFVILMDDFGSGYSSLNMLRSVVVDVIKIDMRFLDMKSDDQKKGLGILESVVNMSSSMGVPVIVEGVENKLQEDYLLGMGCTYAQGYYYYKPMPIVEFEKLLSDEKNLDFSGLHSKHIDQIHLRELMDGTMFSDTMINSIFGPAVFYDMYKNDISITRVNQQYYQMMGVKDDDETGFLTDFWAHVPEGERHKIMLIFNQAMENAMTGASIPVLVTRADGSIMQVNLRLFFVREQNGHHIFFGLLSGIVDTRYASLTLIEKGNITEEQYNAIDEAFGNMSASFGIAKVFVNSDNKPYDYDFVYANNALLFMCGGDLRRMRVTIQKAISRIINEVLQKAYEAAYNKSQCSVVVESASTEKYLKIDMYQYAPGYVGMFIRDVNKQYIYESALKSTYIGYEEVHFIDVEEDNFRIIYPDENSLLQKGNYTEMLERRLANGKIIDDETGQVRRFLTINAIKNALRNEDVIEYRYRRIRPSGEDAWYCTRFTVAERVGNDVKTVVMSIRCLEDLLI